MSLPRLSELALRLSVPSEFHAEILGDLAEEYDRRRAFSERDARRRIRRDTLIAAFSFPGAGLHLTATISIAALAYLFAVLWEIGVASPMARMAASSAPNTAGFSWGAFLSFQMTGFFISAATAAIALNRSRQSLLMNAAVAASPLIIGIAAGPIIFALLRDDPQSILQRLDWMAVSALALAAGASAGAIIARTPTARPKT